MNHGRTSMKYAFVDLETTGGNPLNDRIIDIGVLLVDDDEITSEWQSLINPNCSISPFITQITGISNGDVIDAPQFSDIADHLSDLITNRIFVAHNVRFDYSFIKHEFSRININISLIQLCTVKLSRKLYPQYRSHSLDSLINRFSLPVEQRHRALPDTKAMYSFYKKALNDHGNEIVDQTISSIIRHPSLPSKVPDKVIQSLPNVPGIYIFYNQEGTPLYVGKSINIKDRVLSHFYDDLESSKELHLKEETSYIDTQICAGELEALITESRLIKELMPIYNHQLRYIRGVWIAEITSDSQGYNNLSITNTSSFTYTDRSKIAVISRSKRQLTNSIREICETYELCPKRCGIEKGRGSCFSYHLGKCHGSCIEEETPAQYNRRFHDAFSRTSLLQWPFPGAVVIHEYNQYSDMHAYHIIDKWSLLRTFRVEDELETFSASEQIDYSINLDEYKILSKYIANPVSNDIRIVPR